MQPPYITSIIENPYAEQNVCCVRPITAPGPGCIAEKRGLFGAEEIGTQPHDRWWASYGVLITIYMVIRWWFMTIYGYLWWFMVIYRFLGLLATWRLGFSVLFGLFMSMI